MVEQCDYEDICKKMLEKFSFCLEQEDGHFAMKTKNKNRLYVNDADWPNDCHVYEANCVSAKDCINVFLTAKLFVCIAWKHVYKMNPFFGKTLDEVQIMLDLDGQ